MSQIEQSGIVGPTCMVCLRNIDMSKQVEGWTCPNKHQTVLCNTCFGSLQKDQCPTCKHPIPDVASVRSLRRKLGLSVVVQSIAEYMTKFQEAVQKYSNEQILDVYMERMMEACTEARKPFNERLLKQAKEIIDNTFMLELQSEIDAILQIIKGEEGQANNPTSKIFMALKQYEKKFMVRQILRQHPGAIIIDQS